MRILIVTEIPAPFRIPLFNALAAVPDVELHVCFLAEHDPRRSYRVHRDEFAFEHVVIPGRSLRRDGRWIVLSRGVLRLLRRVDPDVVVIGGWNQPAFWQVLSTTRLMRVPSLLWVESTGRDARVRGPLASGARSVALRLSSGFLVPGRASRQYLQELGVAEERIVTAPNAVDLRSFEDRVKAARHDLGELRRSLLLDGLVFLYAGRLDPEKGLDILIEAMRDVPATAVLIGSGSLEAKLRALGGDRIRFIGQLDRDDLPPWYAAADAFVLPSRSEPWGMVLNEAAAAGLPIVATTAVGAAYDLVEPGVNGFRVPVDDVAALAEALRRLAADPELRRTAGERSRELANGFTPDAWAAGVSGFARQLGARRNAC
jgi:glycosyltransferase involved in cell wall biosynthesis